jgi:hypothetical protein
MALSWERHLQSADILPHGTAKMTPIVEEERKDGCRNPILWKFRWPFSFPALLAPQRVKAKRESRFPLGIGAKSSGNWSLCPMARWKKRQLFDEGQKGSVLALIDSRPLFLSVSENAAGFWLLLQCFDAIMIGGLLIC